MILGISLGLTRPRFRFEKEIQNRLAVPEVLDATREAGGLQILPNQDGVAFVVVDDQDGGRLVHQG